MPSKFYSNLLCVRLLEYSLKKEIDDIDAQLDADVHSFCKNKKRGEKKLSMMQVSLKKKWPILVNLDLVHS